MLLLELRGGSRNLAFGFEVYWATARLAKSQVPNHWALGSLGYGTQTGYDTPAPA